MPYHSTPIHTYTTLCCAVMQCASAITSRHCYSAYQRGITFISVGTKEGWILAITPSRSICETILALNIYIGHSIYRGVRGTGRTHVTHKLGWLWQMTISECSVVRCDGVLWCDTWQWVKTGRSPGSMPPLSRAYIACAAAASPVITQWKNEHSRHWFCTNNTGLFYIVTGGE